MEHKTKIRFPAFDYTVHLIVSPDIVKARTDRAYILGDYEGEAAGLCAHLHDAPEAYLFFQSDCLDFGTIAHEAWHCIRAMLRYVEADLENEVVAYHLGYLVNHIHKFLSKNKLVSWPG